jgi:hypothetical protein
MPQAITETLSYGTNAQLTVTTPTNLAIIGPGVQYWIIANGTGGQFAGLNLPQISLSPSDQGQTCDIGLVDAANNTVAFSAMNPTVYCLANGRYYLQGTSSALAQAVTMRAEIMGRQADHTGYIVVDVTNNGGATLNLKACVLSLIGAHFCRSRYYDTTAATGDAYAIDGTNHLLNLTNSAITGVTWGFATNYGALSTTQHFQVTDTASTPLSTITGSGNLPDTVTATATATKCIYVEIGDNANQISIAASTTTRFVFILTCGATSSAMQTLVSNAKSNYTSDITTYTSYASTPQMSLQSASPHLDMLLTYMLSRERYRSKTALASSGQSFTPAGSYTFFDSFTRDSYQGSMALCQAGNITHAKDIFSLRIATEDGTYHQYHEIGDFLITTGFQQQSSRNGSPGDQDMWVPIIGYEYYIRTLDNTWLTANIASINNILSMLQTWYNAAGGSSTDGCFMLPGNTTYMDSAGNVTGQSNMASPFVQAILCFALRAGIELNTAAGNASQAATWTVWRNTLLAALPALWSSANTWFVFNKSQDGTGVYANPHLLQLQVLLYDALTDPTKQAAMVAKLVGSTYWQSAALTHYMLPTTDPNYGSGSYWDGPGWNLTDFQAISVAIRYGTPSQAQTAWQRLKQMVLRIQYTQLHSPGEHYTNVGQFSFSAGAITELVTRGLFGIDPHASYFTCQPNISKLNEPSGWQLNNFQMGNSTWTITHTGSGPTATMTLDGSAVSGQIAYPSAGTHTLAITAHGRRGVS